MNKIIFLIYIDKNAVNCHLCCNYSPGSILDLSSNSQSQSLKILGG
jgi:hypothetical protein